MSEVLKDNQKWLTLVEAGNYLRLSKETMYRMTTRGEIIHYKVGRKILFSRAELDKFIKSKQRK